MSKKILKRHRKPARFKAVTWNVYWATKTKELRPILRGLLRDGVSMFLMQEAGGDDITKMLEAEGLETFVYREYRLAWDPKVWRRIRTWSKVLSDIRWESNGQMVITECATGRFEHIETGAKGKFTSYHLAPHLQDPDWHDEVPNRLANTKESMKTLVRMSRNSKTDFDLFGGDDNIDENGRGSWDFMTNTHPLVQYQAPRPTHGGGRRIDDFRGAGVKPVSRGSVRKGGGDHKAYVREFEEAA